ncbi:hypothetical protein DFH05DRAFT_1525351 [Lentinula detonsa]|uniref:Uncharacterized protein n=1 Tax=Lentinula detonsa TaxID=2804962 RepID=A0A9W8P049_9AGAR|nr:hypothetical protein DFH05DRAFT_1525351 [Lentinula detonsa]
MTTPAIDYTTCFNPEKPTYSCRGVFAYKDYEGLCARCLHLSSVQDPEEARRDAEAPFCEGCGAIVMFMLPRQKLCGSCDRKASSDSNHQPGNRGTYPEAGSLLSGRELQVQKHAARSLAMANRLLPKTTAPVNNTSSATHSAGAYGGRMIKLYIAPVSPKGTEVWKKIGVASGLFAENDSFLECLADLLRHWNLIWDKRSTESLTLEFIDIRFYGNIVPRPGSDLQTIGYFYDANCQE